MANGRHAFLIMAHEDTAVLRALLRQLDDPRNAIFVHIDQKAGDLSPALLPLVTQTDIEFVKQVRCNWAGFSLVKAEMNLLRAAVGKGPFDYYHLLSGADLLLCDQEQLRAYFLKNPGMEYFNINHDVFQNQDRVRPYHFFQDRIKRDGQAFFNKAMIKLNQFALKAQKALGVHRNRRVRFQKGAQWFSITEDLARLIVSKEAFVKKAFRHTFAPDEMLVQTIYTHFDLPSPTWQDDPENPCCSVARYIDWFRGGPYTFTLADYDLLVDSGMVFARKFSEKTDPDIVKQLLSHTTPAKASNKEEAHS